MNNISKFYIEKHFIDRKKYINFFLKNINNKKKNGGSFLYFEGIVREKNFKKNVFGIFYEIYYNLCVLKINDIYIQSVKKYNLIDFICVHRSGLVRVGYISLFLIIYSFHRKESLYSCNFIMDKIKFNVPIWKKEIYLDKTYKWI